VGDVGGGPAAGGGDPGVGGSVGVTDPPGYVRWGDWHGCAWTGVGTKGASTVTPKDFVAKPATEAFCVKGVVGAEPMYESVALLGFNVNEPNTTTCESKAVDTSADGPPAVTVTSAGLAVDFVKQGADTSFTLRVQVQGPNGHKDGDVGAADRWCANIVEVQGKTFLPWSEFTPSCWETAVADRGTPFDPAKNPVSAIVFPVPGAPTDTPYDFCINGFAYGSSAADAPDGPAQVGNQMGTVGNATNLAGDFERAKILVGGENYIIQNNNWGDTSGTQSACILNFLNNSFTVSQCTGSGSSAPAAFPSIYIGANGNTLNGMKTSTTDNMPIQISAIKDIQSTFRYSGGGGSYNSTYDIWFANSPPTTEYKDGINGFVMVWLRDPSGKQPIGSNQGSVTIAGQQWNKWVGPRGDGSNAPVVSFVNPAEDDNSRAQSFVNKNLLDFIKAAAGDGIGSNMYLTDVFGGFEIWSGGTGLKVDEFTAIVNK
jgi:hypothetical protein